MTRLVTVASLLALTLPALATDTLLVSANRNYEEFGVPSMVTVDPAGNIVVVGRTNSPDLPVTNGSMLSGEGDAFLVRLDATGTRILFASYFGGPGGSDNFHEVAFAPDGAIYVLGNTDPMESPDPNLFDESTAANTTAPATYMARFDPSFHLQSAIYTPLFVRHLTIGDDGAPYALSSGGCVVYRFAADLSSMVYSRAFDGTCFGVAGDGGGNAYLAGSTDSDELPVTAGALQPTRRGSRDGLLVKLNAVGDILYATYLGGHYTGPDHVPANPDNLVTGASETAIRAVALDPDGNIVLAGSTFTSDFPTTPSAAQAELRANCPYSSGVGMIPGFPLPTTEYRMDDVFVTKLDPAGSGILASTLLGGNCYEKPESVAVTSDGGIWVAGSTNSNPFPQAVPFHAGPPAGATAGFVAKLDPQVSHLLLSSYLPGDSAGMLTFDGSRRLWIAGLDFAGLFGTVPDQGPHLTSVGNLFSRRNGPVTPGTYTLVTADGLDDVAWQHLLWAPAQEPPRALSDIEVLFDSVPAAIYAAGPGYVELIAPDSIAGKRTVSIQLVYRGVPSPVLLADVAGSDYELLSADFSGSGHANARNQDETLNAPDNPARPGSTVYFFFTGAGETASGCPDGAISSGGEPAPIVLVNGAESLQSHPVPGFLCGMYYIAYPVPADWDARTEATIHIAPDQESAGSQTLNFSVAP